MAVITGAANGIGFALADRLSREGTHLVLADIDLYALQNAAKKLQQRDAKIITVKTDVTQKGDIENLVATSYDAFENVHILCNNAGIFPQPQLTWEATDETWRRNLDVNLWGVIYGIQAFIPRMIAQDTQCHVINVASLGGHIAEPQFAPYSVAKFGVVALTEAMYYELSMLGSKINTSLVCPGFVKTNLLNTDDFNETSGNSKLSGRNGNAVKDLFKQSVESGLSPEIVADKIISSIKENRFYVFTHDYSQEQLRTRLEPMIAEQNPVVTDAMKKLFNL